MSYERYEDTECSSLEGKERFLCFMLKNLFWFDKPELSFGVYRVFKKKKKLIEKVLGEIANDIENKLTEEGSFEKLKGFVMENTEELLSKIERDRIEKSSDIDRLIETLRKIREDYEIQLEEAPEEDKEGLQEIINKLNVLIEEIHQKKDLKSSDIYNHLYNFFSLYYHKGDFGYTKNRYNIFQVSYTEKDFITQEGTSKIVCEESPTEKYDGSEVLFRWQTWDTYYIKTLKYTKDYEVKNLKLFGKILNAKFTIDLSLGEGENKKKLKLEKIQEQKGKLILTFTFSDTETKIDEVAMKILKALRVKENSLKLKNPITGTEKEISLKELLVKGSEKSLATRMAFLNKINFPDKGKINDKEKVERVFEENKDLKGVWKLLRSIALFIEGSESDYFIHKNLKRFLTKELDKYIKNRIFSDTDDLLNNPNTWEKLITLARIFKENAQKLIDVLAQIEDFQKKLWEMRKLVKRAEYIIASNLIKDEEILILALENESQRKDWQELGIPLPDGIEDLKSKSYPIDTKHFSLEQKYRILSCIDDLEEKLSGVLIKSENFQALKFLEPKYRERVKTIYIDPPYNTGSDDFLYKDNYLHSSWLTMMENRLELAKELLKNNGVIFINIDDHELDNLSKLIKHIFGDSNFVTNFIRIATKRYKGDVKHVDIIHDYILTFAKSKELINLKENKEKHDDSKYKEIDEYVEERGKHLLRPLDNNSIRYSPQLDYEITAPDGTKIVAGGDYKKYLERKQGNYKSKDWCFRWKKEKFEWGLKNGFIVFKEDENGKLRVYFKIYQYVDNDLKPRNPFKSPISLLDGFYNNQGTSEIKNLGLDYTYPKPTSLINYLIKISSDYNSLILDFFAGSGTTAHAVALLNTKDAVNIINKIINLQKEIRKLKDKKTIEEKKEQLRKLEEKLIQIEFEKRKYILVEVNDYFDTVIIPRIKKLMYSLVWKKGKPQYPFGYFHVFKYLYLEQYEDLLDLYGDLSVEENDQMEFIFAKDFTKLTEKRILPLLQNPINGSYDLLETYLFHNAMSLKSVSYKEGVLRAELIDRYGKKVLMLLSNDKEKLIESLNFEDFSPYDRVVANIDHPDLEKIKKDPENVEFIKKKDLAGV